MFLKLSPVRTLFLIFALLLPSLVLAQAEGEELLSESLSFEERLSQLHETLAEKEKEKKSLKKMLKTEADTVTQEQMQQDLAAAEDIILGIREEIISLSTGGAQLFDEPPVVKEDFDWQRDLEKIFEPLLDQLKQISERPRLIEKLEADIDYWEKREQELQLAITNLEANKSQLSKKNLKKEIDELLVTADTRHTSAKQKLSLLRSELTTLKKAKNPIFSTMGDIFSTIVVGIILHFFAAIIAAFFTYQFVRLLSFIPIYFVTKNKPAGTVLAERAIVIGRNIVGVVLSLLIYFTVLYSFAEWLLLVISVLIIAGFVLGLKDAIPAYFIEIKTLLNMGTIRHGERLDYKGLPWRVSRLNVHTYLHNPALHGHLRVSLAEIAKLSSRPYHSDEPWFPTKVGDIVFIEDGAFGQILRQTPDLVEVDFGGSIYSYTAVDFIARRPRNLSRQGFTIYEVFGFDYQHQKEITTTILDTYRNAIKQALSASPFGEHNTYFDVEFDNASASSLDIKILASFSGEVAAEYFKIKRLLQKTSVEVANKEGWVIPFQQLTVHHQPIE
jgi:hypothetical protein